MQRRFMLKTSPKPWCNQLLYAYLQLCQQWLPLDIFGLPLSPPPPLSSLISIYIFISNSIISSSISASLSLSLWCANSLSSCFSVPASPPGFWTWHGLIRIWYTLWWISSSGRMLLANLILRMHLLAPGFSQSLVRSSPPSWVKDTQANLL